MRKISEQASYEFWNNGKFNKSNTKVEDNNLFLFGRVIATYISESSLFFSLRGYPTVTTRERLRALGVPIYQRNGNQYVNGELISSDVVYKYNIATKELSRPTFLPREVLDSRDYEAISRANDVNNWWELFLDSSRGD